MLYPIGLWLLTCVLLAHAARDIIEARESYWVHTTSFLHREFKPIFFWWELAEKARRFILVGLFVVVKPGTVTQVFLAVLTCASFLMVQLQARPVRTRDLEHWPSLALTSDRFPCGHSMRT